MKKIILILITLLLLTSCSKKVDVNQTLIDSISKEAMYFLTHGEDSGESVSNYIKNDIVTTNDALPSRYDLREHDLVTNVKDQSPYGTCWAFGALGASETAILSELNETVESYKNKYGEYLDVSEFYHAYFALTEASDNDGFIMVNNWAEYTPYIAGGNDFATISSLANLNGLNLESDYPYDEDYKYDEELRHSYKFMLQDADFLLSPCGTDENGEYKYIEEGTNAIKKALVSGKAVNISYAAAYLPLVYNYQDVYNSIKNFSGSERIKSLYAGLKSKTIGYDGITKEEALELFRFRLRINQMDEDMYDFSEYDTEFILKALFSDYFGESFEAIIEDTELDLYHDFINGETYGQYCDYITEINHEVLIVGYDDNYSKENFNEGHRPIADGAFIVRNSWGDDWADNGYFYLSYYDHTISSPVIYNYYLNDEVPQSDISLYSYDNMNIEGINNTLFDTLVKSANIYKIEGNGTIFTIGTYTANLNTNITYEVYKLNDINDSLDKGKRLYKASETFAYGGYHTHDLSEEITVNNGDVIAVVITEKVDKNYALVNGFSLSKKGYEAIENNEVEYTLSSLPTRYANSIIEDNQSYIYVNKTWINWKDVVEEISSTSKECSYLTYDNLPIKLLIETN